MLSRLSASSLIFVILSAMLGRLSTALAQLIAAFYLSPTDFGIYATAMGVMLITTMMRGGGTGNHMLTMTPQEFRLHGGRIFWYGQFFIAIGVGITLLIALPVTFWFASHKGYLQSDLLHTLMMLAAAFVLTNLCIYPRTRLMSQLRLKEISALDSMQGIIKLFATWIFAANGFGPIALAVPIAICALFEIPWIWSRSGATWKELIPARGWLGPTIKEMRLPLVMALLATLCGQTDTLVGSLFVPVSVIGFYFFASQLAIQPAMMMSGTLRAVFTAASAQMRSDPENQNNALRTLFNGSMVFIPLVTLFIPAVFEPFERAVWNGKWGGSYWPVLILSTTLVYPTALQLVAAPIAGARDWHQAIRIDLLRAIPKLLAAGVAGLIIIWLQLDSFWSGVLLALAVGLAGAFVAAQELMRIMKNAGVSPITLFYEMYSTPFAALLCAFAASGLADSFLEPMQYSFSVRTMALIECALSGIIYLMLTGFLLRFGYSATLERLTEALPAILRPLSRKVFFLDV